MGTGESEVLTWARQHTDFEALLDDRAARNCALAFHIPVRGTLGVLLLAKQNGLVSQVEPLLRELTSVGLRLSPEISAAVLKLAGE